MTGAAYPTRLDHETFPPRPLLASKVTPASLRWVGVRGPGDVPELGEPPAGQCRAQHAEARSVILRYSN